MLGRVVAPVVDVLDVDGIVQRIDVNELLDKVDWDRLLENVDLDRVLDRVDVNRQLDRINVSDLVDRAQIGAIVARGTTGLCGPLIDGARAQIIMIDRVVHGTGWLRKNTVPPAPARHEERLPQLPKGPSKIAIALQGRYAGTFSRGLAFLLDQVVTTSLFFVVLLLIDRAYEVIMQSKLDAVEVSYSSITLRIIYFVWVFVYQASALAASSRTLGKAVLGLKVVNNQSGQSIDGKTALIRALVLFPCIWIIIGVIIGVIREDRRELQDMLSATAVVYSWDAQFERYRRQEEESDDDEDIQSELSHENDEEQRPAKSPFRLFQRRVTRKPQSIRSQPSSNLSAHL